MRILVLTPYLYDTAPAPRFRFEQWARYLEPDGFRFSFVPFEDESLHRYLYRRGHYTQKALLMTRSLARRFALLPRVRDYDVVLLHREAALLGPAIVEWLIVRQKVPIVYDFDDPIWLSNMSAANRWFGFLKCPSKVAHICRLATIVTVGNHLIAGWALQHARDVEVVPSTIDLPRYPMKSLSVSQSLTLGWTGSHSTLLFLESLVPMLRRFVACHPCKLLVISHKDTYGIEFFPAEVLSKQWQAATEAEDLLEMDVGLAPFPDDDWTPWRCHGKVLQYMAAGIPLITSPIGILPDYIEDGENGFLAATEEEWIDRLTRLAKDISLRQKMGLAGRATVAQRYSAQVWAPRFKDILLRAVSVKERIPASFGVNGTPGEEQP